MKILVAYGSIGGNTYLVAQKIQEVLQSLGHDPVDFVDMEVLEPDQLHDYDVAFLGASTWDEADYNDFAKMFFDKFNSSDISVKKIKFALFGLGDKFYGDAYCASIKTMKKDLAAKGAKYLGEPILIDGPPDDSVMEDVSKWVKEMLENVKG